MRSRRRDLSAAFSLANLCFVQVWSDLIYAPRQQALYYMRRTPGVFDYAAVVLNVAALGGLLFALLSLRRHRVLGRLLFWACLFFPANAARLYAPSLRRYGWMLGEPLAVAAALLVGGGALVLLVRHWRRFEQGLLVSLAILAPFVVLTVGQALAGLVAAVLAGREQAASAPAPPPAAASGRAVLVLVFDELDERFCSAGRPAGLPLPALERLRAESVCATRATSPSPNTLEAIPSLTLGSEMVRAVPRGAAELFLEPRPPAAGLLWSQTDTVFDVAHREGFATAVVGWHHPYCRLFADVLHDCTWEPDFLTVVGQTTPAGLASSLSEQVLSLSPFHRRRLALRAYQATLENARKAVVRPGSGLRWIHFPIPHSPAIYDRAAAAFTTANFSLVGGYLDNVALVDRTLAELRSVMEAAGTWRETTLVLTADHAWREAHKHPGTRPPARVPLCVKLAGRPQPGTYDCPISTTVVRELSLSLLRGELSDSASLVGWLAHASGASTDCAGATPPATSDPAP